MNKSDSIFQRGLSELLVEVFEGPPGAAGYFLNPGDPGLLRQLESISASAASARPIQGRSTIAAHADHVHYGLSLLNRWAAGEANPWSDADWNDSWKRTTVSDEQWRDLLARLRKEATTWRTAASAFEDWDDATAAGALSSVAHTAYHLGAIRQIVAAVG